MQTSTKNRAAGATALVLSLWGMISAVVATPHAVVAAQDETRPTVIEATTKSARKIAPPANIVGPAWSWTTISGVGYKNSTTGQLLSPSGMSAKFTFTKDGRYKKFFYIQQRTYDMVTQSTTTEDGTATFYDNGTVLLTPVSGHYLGNIGSKIIDRDMTATERKPTTWSWEWRTENGKQKLYIGPGPSSLKPFEHDK